MARQRLSSEQWARLIHEQQTSGVSVDRFCTNKGLGVSTFTKWRRRLHGGMDAPAAPGHRPGNFVEAVPAAHAVVVLVVNETIRLELPVTLGASKIAELTHALATHGRL